LRRVPGLEDGVLDEAQAGLVGLVDAQVTLGPHDDAGRCQQLADLAHLPALLLARTMVRCSA
jgi:hypothetical protein